MEGVAPVEVGAGEEHFSACGEGSTDIALWLGLKWLSFFFRDIVAPAGMGPLLSL